MDSLKAMAELKQNFPHVNLVFRKFSVFPATQNADERLFSMVGRNTGALSRRIKTTTIEWKVVVSKAIQRHGFIFSYEDANAESSCDEQDSY